MTRVSLFLFFFFKQKTAYEMRISDWSSDVCSSDLVPTFRAFLDGDYAVWAKANQKAHKQNLNRLATAFKPLLDKRLDDITGLDVERWRAGEIERGLSLETINRDISSIKAAFNRAVDWELIGTNPLAKVKKSRTDDCIKVRFLSDDEEARLRSAEHTSELQSLMSNSYAV